MGKQITKSELEQQTEFINKKLTPCDMELKIKYDWGKNQRSKKLLLKKNDKWEEIASGSAKSIRTTMFDFMKGWNSHSECKK